MEDNKDINEKFEELVRKAEEDSKRLQKKYDFGLLIIEMVLQLSGIAVIIYHLGWAVGGGLFLWFTGNNLQVMRTIKKNLEK